MKFQRFHIKLKTPAGQGNKVSEPVMVPDGASKTAMQFLYSLSNPDNIPATVKLMQSIDGVNFDPITDVAGNQLSIELCAGNASATLSVLGILTLWIRFDFEFHTNTTGIIYACNILFS